MVECSAGARETGCLSGTGSTAMKRQVQLHTDEPARGEAEEMRPELQRKARTVHVEGRKTGGTRKEEGKEESRNGRKRRRLL